MPPKLDFVIPDVDINFIVNASPGYMYWKNLNSVYIGCNHNFAIVCGLENPSDIIGKTDYDLPWGLVDEEIAKKFIRNDKYVIETGSVHVSEDDNLTVNNAKGLPIIVRSEKSLLADKKGNIVGILGVAVDITDRREAERLGMENAAHKSAVEEQRKFRKVADQVAHDIRSPLASLSMLLKFCDILPETQRLALKNATARIGDIANNLLNQFKPADSVLDTNEPMRRPLLISTELLEVLSEKKYEYQEKSVELIHEFSQGGNFAFSNVDIQSFKRSISNLINNSIDAFEESKHGVVKLSLEASEDLVIITIQDNGRGMPAELVNQIMNNVVITKGKPGGHGLGLTQVREMLKDNNGTLTIKSKAGSGTKVVISLPKVDSPEWIAEKISLNDDDMVVILDDDPSIHGAWEARFDGEFSKIARKHFESGEQTIRFIASLSEQDKQKVFLLSDYELLNQDLNGLNVIEKTKIERSILVTSHHNNKNVLQLASLMNTKILPKLLASEVPFDINSKKADQTEIVQSIDLVIVDDDQLLVTNLKKFLFNKNNVDVYFNVKDFLASYLKYPKNIAMLIDNNFKGEEITGFEILEKLHESGFSNLYLFSGTDFSQNKSIPKYFKTILKDDINAIKKIIQ